MLDDLFVVVLLYIYASARLSGKNRIILRPRPGIMRGGSSLALQALITACDSMEIQHKLALSFIGTRGIWKWLMDHRDW